MLLAYNAKGLHGFAKQLKNLQLANNSNTFNIQSLLQQSELSCEEVSAVKKFLSKDTNVQEPNSFWF